MLCPICKADIPADSAFCPKCGQRIGSAEVAAAAPAGGNPTAAERMRTAQQAGAAHAEPEHELWRGRYTPKDMYAKWVLAGLVTIAAIVLAVVVPNPAAWIAAAIVIPVIWLGLLMMLVSRRLGVEYTLTTQRFLHKTGLLLRVADQILLVDIDDITYEQGIPGRILNFGTITLRAKDLSLRAEKSPRAKDSNNEKLTLVPVDNVQHVANLIDEARREERRKRAIYMPSA